MSSEFGLDVRGTVAILGGHSIGGMDENGSGYTGNWNGEYPSAFMFNNKYYKNLANRNLQWEHFDAR